MCERMLKMNKTTVNTLEEEKAKGLKQLIGMAIKNRMNVGYYKSSSH